MFSRFPRIMLREKRVVYSKHQLLEKLKEASQFNKACELSLYSFEEINDRKPIIKSAVIDCLLWEGDLNYCRNLCNNFKNDKWIILNNGQNYQLIVFR